MKVKRLIILITVTSLILIGLTLFAFRYKSHIEIDVAKVNDIAESLAEGWDSVGHAELPCLKYKMDYVILDSSNHFVKATRSGLGNNLTSAIRNGDLIVDIKSDNKVLGKLIIYNNSNTAWLKFRFYFITLSFAIIIITAIAGIIFLIFTDRTIFGPFRKLQAFARRVAEGNLDIPLEMDKGNLFGAFTESFDLMREELKKARENERLANQSKKELVASLSHDIKTPVASIRAVSEVMLLKTLDEQQRNQLEIISTKADLINTLITNMFNAAMEEQQQLKVTITEQSSQILYDLIRKADYNHTVITGSIPGCIIVADLLRIEQVIDNVISNSYKYAGTKIELTAKISGKYLELAFKDYGNGVSADEIPLLFNKYYRAGNSTGKSGAGLGLYISKYLMHMMSGDIFCKNVEEGFCITLHILIA